MSVAATAGAVLEIAIVASTFAKAFMKWRKDRPADETDEEAAIAYGKAVAGNTADEALFDAAYSAWQAKHGA